MKLNRGFMFMGISYQKKLIVSVYYIIFTCVTHKAELPNFLFFSVNSPAPTLS
jgi:hypothetical protein